MPRVTVDATDGTVFSNVEEAGTYRATIQKIGDPKSGPKAQYMRGDLKVNEGQSYEGSMLFVNLPIDGEGSGIFVDFWNKAMQLDEDDDEYLEVGETFDVDTDDLNGQELDLVVTMKEFPEGSGEMRPNVARFLRCDN